MDQRLEKAALLRRLAAHAPFDAEERAHLARLADFVRRSDAPFDRATREGHVTASAFVVDAAGARALLVHHRKLGLWVQPGGHCEPGRDRDLRAAVLREVEEETGLRPDQVEVGAAPFDVDVHDIPARGAAPAHQHHDVRYLVRVVRGAEDGVRHDALESHALAWRPLAELARLADASVARMARKLLAREVRAGG